MFHSTKHVYSGLRSPPGRHRVEDARPRVDREGVAERGGGSGVRPRRPGRTVVVAERVGGGSSSGVIVGRGHFLPHGESEDGGGAGGKLPGQPDHLLHVIVAFEGYELQHTAHVQNGA